MKKILIVISIIFLGVMKLSALESSPEEALNMSNIKVGCWVEYNIIVEENTKEKLVFNCFIKLYGVEGDMLDFEYKIDGIGTRIEISRKDFPLSRLVPKIARATSYKESTEEKLALKEMDNQLVATTHNVWNYENGITEVWQSKDVPFSVVKVACKGFVMELRAFSWAEE